MFEYEEEIAAFAEALQAFIDKYELPEKWFKKPDHIAIKAADGLDYVYRLEELLPDSQQTSQIEMDGRRLGTLNLTHGQPVGDWNVSWLELMEPRPEKVGKDVIGLEHIEFFYPDFDEITETLDSIGVAYKRESNPGHNWISITINDQNQELKLNDKLLAVTVAEELKDGRSHLI